MTVIAFFLGIACTLGVLWAIGAVNVDASLKVEKKDK